MMKALFTRDLIMNLISRICFTVMLAMSVQLTALAAEPVRILMQTSAGDITLELYPEAAPITVENFLRLVDGGFYQGASFYRVVRMDNQAQNKIKIEVIQGGLADAEDDIPLQPIVHETTEDTGITHIDGAISMARLEPGSARSEFFICINNQPELDYGGQRNPDGQGFAAFGRVTEGMEVVRNIQNMKTENPPEGELEYTSGQMLLDPVIISKMMRIPVKSENQ
jgi:peptidyl-prolyl cis-trans isomerase A (cyclophilin A)